MPQGLYQEHIPAKQDWIIIANGIFLIKEIIEEACQSKLIIALDGAANRLKVLGIKPDVILGDFDSIKPHTWGIAKTFAELSTDDQPYMGQDCVLIVPRKNQHSTDLTKGIQFCNQHDARSITIICATGGRMDHHEGALRDLRSAYNKHRPIVLHTEQQSICFAKDETVTMTGEIGDKCGILAFPAGKLTSQGLEYEAKDFPLQFGFSENICNSLTATKVTLEISGEALVIMPPQLNSQRTFMQKTESERLQLQLRDAIDM